MVGSLVPGILVEPTKAESLAVEDWSVVKVSAACIVELVHGSIGLSVVVDAVLVSDGEMYVVKG